MIQGRTQILEQRALNAEGMFEKHYEHFKERLMLRHNMDITIEEYQSLIDSFKGEMKGLGSNTYGTVEFKGETLWVIKKSEYGTLGTVYPRDVNDSVENMIRMVFAIRINGLCLAIWSDIQKELDSCKDLKFETQEEAWKYFDENNTHLPLLMQQWKGRLTNIMVCKYINRLLIGDNPAIKIAFERKKDYKRKSVVKKEQKQNAVNAEL